MENKLERIFFRKGKIVDRDSNEIKPEQIGRSFVVLLGNYLDIAENVEREIKNEVGHNQEYSEANAYVVGVDKRQSNESWNRLTYVPITLYKILK